MMTIDSAKLAMVTGGAPQTPQIAKPVLPEPPPTVATVPVTNSLVNASAGARVARSVGSWFGWGQSNSK